MPTSIAVPLRFASENQRVWIREVRGFDEEEIGATDTLTALRLIDRVLISTDDVASPPAARSLTASDRDRLLAALYSLTYGPRVASTLRCQRCAERFDLDFQLGALQKTLEPDGEADANSEYFTASDGTRLRLPTGADELAVTALTPGAARRALLARCVVATVASGIDLEAEMRRVAPIIDVDIGAGCPHCGAEQRVRFDIQSYLLGFLLVERPRLAREVHGLARAYGWSRRDILELPRRVRRDYIALIDDERTVRRSAFA